MLTSIDCLLKNTEVIDAVKAAVEYIGASRAKEGKDASLGGIYKTLREHGVEIDLGSAAHIYSETLSTKNHPSFNTHKEVNEIAGKYFDDLSRNLIIRENKTGEKKIGEMSPAEAAAKKLTDAFVNEHITDERTKNILRTMQDAYMQYAQKILGKSTGELGEKDARTFQEIVQQAIEKESMGYVDKTTGQINGFDKLHEGAKVIVKKLSDQVSKSGDPILKEQWDGHMKSFENSIRTMMFSTKEGQKVLHDALKTPEGGSYVKTLKDGTEVIDHEKLAGDINSITQYRENVINALTAHGFTEDQANKTSDGLQKEFIDLRAKSLETLRKIQERKEESFEPTEAKAKSSIADIVKKALKQAESYSGLKNEAEISGENVENHAPKLTFSKTETNKIVGDALKNAEYGKQGPEGGKTIDWLKLATNKPDVAALNKIITEHLKNNGFTEDQALRVADNLLRNKAHEQLLEDIATHSKTALDQKQAQLSKEIAPVNKSDMTRLAELHAMGIFGGAHDDLLHHVLGIDSADQETRKNLMELMDKKQQLIQQIGSHEFLYHSLDAKLQHEVNNLIDENIADKGKMGRVAKALYDYQNFVNMGIIANSFNIAENTLSGLQANLGATLGTFRQMGMKQGVKIFYEMQRVWRATLKDVAKGGTHYGIESGKFTQGSAIADKLTINRWKELNAIQKVATVAIAYAHAGLNGMDSAYKVAIHQKTTMLNLHKALTEVLDENGRKMSRDEANEYLNEKIFGQSLEDAKKRTEYIYKQLGLKYDKNNIERSARELVTANLFSDGQINADIIEAAIKGAYNVASVGLGHEARKGFLGYVSGAKMFKGLQNIAQQGYDKLIKDGHYDAAAWYKIGVQTTLINGVFKFAHGVANWMVLRPLTAGLGLVTGTISKHISKSDIIDYSDKKQLESAFAKSAQANMDINRAIVGLSYFALSAGATGLFGMLNKEDPDEGNLAAGFKAIKKNPILNKAMNKFGSDALALMYASYTAKRHGRMEENFANVEGFTKYVEGLTNVGSGYSIPERLQEIKTQRSRGTLSADKKAAGIAGELLKTISPAGNEVPFYRSYKGAYYLGKSAVQGKSELPPFYNPQSTFQGFMDNGIYNDLDKMFRWGTMFPKDREEGIEPAKSLY